VSGARDSMLVMMRKTRHELEEQVWRGQEPGEVEGPAKEAIRIKLFEGQSCANDEPANPGKKRRGEK